MKTETSGHQGAGLLILPWGTAEMERLMAEIGEEYLTNPFIQHFIEHLLCPTLGMQQGINETEIPAFMDHTAMLGGIVPQSSCQSLHPICQESQMGVFEQGRTDKCQSWWFPQEDC